MTTIFFHDQQENHEMRRRTSIDMVEQIKRRRSMEIYSTMKEQRELMRKASEEQSPKIETEWQQQGLSSIMSSPLSSIMKLRQFYSGFTNCKLKLWKLRI